MKAGSLIRLELVNFMSHDNFTIDFNPKINFITGVNGSGKSAIVTALVIVLGGKAKWTGRGDTLKDLIKTGRNSCKIKVSICNSGDNAFESDTFGNVIVVIRQLLASGSSNYKIQNQDGLVVSQSRNKLDEILMALNIHVNNPLAILHQDVARSFLNSDDPIQKYKFYAEATLLESIEEQYIIIDYNIEESNESILKKKKSLDIIFEDIKELKRKKKALMDAEHKRLRRDGVINELAWAKVYEAEISLKNENDSKEEKYKKYVELKTDLLNYNTDCSSQEQQKRQLRERETEKMTKIDNLNSDLRIKRQEFRQKNDSLENVKTSLINMESKLKYLKKEESAMREIVFKATHPDPELENKQKEAKNQLDIVTENIADLETILKTSEVEKNQLEENCITEKIKLMQYKRELDEYFQEEGNLKRKISRLKQESNNLSMYSNSMPRILAAINEERGFREKPRGPLGSYIKVKDSSWAPAVEGYLGRSFLSGFCISDNENDFKLLNKIFKRLCNSYEIPNIFKGPFLNQVHRGVAAAEVKHPILSNLLRGLEISDPNVTNCLIDNQGIETVLMIPTNTEAYVLMGNVRNVPKNCKRAFTKEGNIFYPAPFYKSYAGNIKTKTLLLQVDNNDTIRCLHEELQNISEKISKVRELKLKTEKNCEDLEKSIRKLDQDISKNRNKRQNLINSKRRIEESLDMSLCVPETLNPIYDNLQTIVHSISIEEQKIKDQRCRQNDLKKEVDDMKNEINNIVTSVEEFSLQKMKIGQDIDRLNRTILQLESKKSTNLKKLEEYEISLNKAEKKINEGKFKLNSLKDDANQFSPLPVLTKRSVDEVTMDLNNLNIYLEAIEKETGGDLETVTTRLNERQEEYLKLGKIIDKYEQCTKMFEDGFKTKNRMFNKTMNKTGIFVSHRFGSFLKKVNFKGEIDFNHKKKELYIKVHPLKEEGKDTRSTSSLSGGERSYSTAAFVMSLWEFLELPFYFLDEFDVFMDDINRTKILELLLNKAKALKKQFIFISPLNVPWLNSSEDVSIFRLEPPRERPNKLSYTSHTTCFK